MPFLILYSVNPRGPSGLAATTAVFSTKAACETADRAGVGGLRFAPPALRAEAVDDADSHSSWRAPGRELKELGISPADLARQIKVPVNRIMGIIKRERGISADTALRLAHWFGTSAEFWLNLQKIDELRAAQLRIGDAIERLPRRDQALTGT